MVVIVVVVVVAAFLFFELRGINAEVDVYLESHKFYQLVLLVPGISFKSKRVRPKQTARIIWSDFWKQAKFGMNIWVRFRIKGPRV